MILIRFPDAASERRALGYLAGRFSFKSWASGETLVPEGALPALAVEGIRFTVEGTATYQVGDVVRFRYGPRKVTGTVKEDRGPIGVGGRQLYLIQFTLEPEYTSAIELPAEEIELVRNQFSLE